MAGKIGGKRKADVFAKKGSLADRLRKRRMAIEKGYSSGHKPKKKKSKK